MPEPISAHLLGIYSLIACSRNHAQHCEACDQEGRPVRPNSSNAVKWSIFGALQKVTYHDNPLRWVDARVSCTTTIRLWLYYLNAEGKLPCPIETYNIEWINDSFSHETVIGILKAVIDAQLRFEEAEAKAIAQYAGGFYAVTESSGKPEHPTD